LEGHIWGNMLEHPDLATPFIVLVVSGGHTQLVYVPAPAEYEILGRTRDDAAGEAFDKVGKLLNVGYPGGPIIEQLAKKGDASRISFPRAYLGQDSLEFSFSGLKTAVLNYVEKIGPDETQATLNDIAAGFQQAVLDVLIDKTMLAAKKMNVTIACLAGGVAANKTLQNQMSIRGESEGIRVFWPSLALCSDNAGMIARAGYYYLAQGKQSPLSLSPKPSLNL
ncbi:tRNA (adenosine(37)-N6)-threonylcarbamoyltransferase complex transferase subunit TsaD, partial [candidate division KSB1 bacterium]|nr:tRNA (adenosine(37)-N6)-threonylcarbamoyltransferase complex transferase subunit TsaD [candidate division KSB1 bacterium]